MKNFKTTALLFALVVLKFATVARGDSSIAKIPRRITMYPGDGQKIQAPEGYTALFVSRRGIVDITQISADTWYLLALKKGLITLQFESFDSADVFPTLKFHVEVRSASNKPTKITNKPKQHALKPYQRFKLRAWLVVQESTSQDIVGAIGSISRLWRRGLPIDPDSFHDKLATNDSHILAAPVLHLGNDAPSQIKAGGEFRTSESGTVRELPIWKDYGTEFKLAIVDSDEISARLDYDVSLRDLAGGLYRALSGGSFKGTLQIPLQQVALVATMDINSNRQGSDVSYFLGNVPIVGPLFRQRDRHNRQSKLFLFVYIDNDPLPEQVATPAKAS